MHAHNKSTYPHKESMKGMFRISCGIRSPSELLATAAVQPGKGIARSITIGPSSVIIRPWSPFSSSSCSRPAAVSANLVGAAERGGGSTSRLSSLGSTQELRRFGCQELTISARDAVCRGRSSSGCKSCAGDRFLVRRFSRSVCAVSSLSSICVENYHFRSKTPPGLLGCRGRGGLPSVVPGGLQTIRKRVCHCSLPALSCRRGVCVVESKNSSRAARKKAVSLSRVSGLSGKDASGHFERMELFKPQLIDTMPFRFMSEYHTAPPRAAKDAISPIFFFGFGQAKPVVEVVQAGDPVLHEPAVEVRPEEIGTARIEKIINDMVATMRNAPGVGLAAPQIGVNLQIIVLEDTKEYMGYSSPEECEAQQRFPFDLLVIINPKLKARSGSGSAFFFEGCLSVEGYRALVERELEVEVTGVGRDGRPIRVEASGWKARILQHECDHLGGTLYVDKMVPRTFRTKDNLRLPLPAGCPKQGVCKHSTKSLKL